MVFFRVCLPASQPHHTASLSSSSSSSAGDWLIYRHICVRRLYSHILIVLPGPSLLKTNSGRLICSGSLGACTGNGLIFATSPARPNGVPSDIRDVSQRGGDLFKKTSRLIPGRTQRDVSAECQAMAMSRPPKI